VRFAGSWLPKAIASGWSQPALFAVPSNWHRLDETGAALLIGRWDVGVTAEAIVIKPPWSQSQLKIYRRDTLKGGAT
jgi:hypothetical protein